MKKQFVTLLVGALFISTTHAFAQLKTPLTGAKTLTGLTEAITRASSRSFLSKLEQRAFHMQGVRFSGQYQQAWQQFYRGHMRSNSLPTALCKFYTLHPELLHTGLTKIVEKSTGHRYMVLEPVLRIPGTKVYLYSLDNTAQEGVEVERAQLLDASVYEIIE